jgi:Holliday junction resolvasome RuvABC endonuclease subunit
MTTTLIPRVMGLDLSANSSGVALPDGTTTTIQAPKQAGKKRTLTDDLNRMDHAAHGITQALRTRPHVAAIEDYTPGTRSAAAHRLAEISGIARLACHRAGARIALVNPKHLKIYACGTTSAEKRDMAIAAYKRARAEFPNSDECDAWWLRAMCLDALGHPLFDMPKTNRAAIDKVTWPTLTEAT